MVTSRTVTKAEPEPRTLLIDADDKQFKVKIPGYASITFGPFSPPSSKSSGGYGEGTKRGTLRVYGRTKQDMLALFTGVTAFRDTSNVEYELIWTDPASIPLKPEDVPF